MAISQMGTQGKDNYLCLNGIITKNNYGFGILLGQI